MQSSIIPTSESITVEFKKTFNEDVIETLVAFSNAKGGTVYIGVTDNGEVKGITIGKETIQNWINEVKTKTATQIIPDVEIHTVDNKTVVSLYTMEYPIKPIATRGRYYKRIGNANHLMTVVEISDLYMQSMQNSWDSYLYQGAHFNDLDFDKIEQFILKVNQVRRFSLPLNHEEALKKLNMIQHNTPTNGAMILFSKQNLRYNVHIGRFKTPSLIIADKLINGNLFDVLEESMQTIVGHLKFAFEITGKTTQRTEIPEYPLDAIRELLVNALVHRDYQSPTDIQIRVYDNSISFFNPSGLYGNITVEDLKTDSYQASTRNKLIAEAFYLTNEIEKYGSGFIRIRKAIAEYPTMKFEYHNLGHGFLTQFSYTKQKVSSSDNNVTEKDTEKDTEQDTEKVVISKNQKTILEKIAGNNYITAEELVETVGINLRNIKQNISKLKSKGLIERIGPDKGGYWKVNS